MTTGKTLNTNELPPWNPGKRLRGDFSGTNNTGTSMRVANNEPTINDDSLIIQWVWKWTGRDTYLGKITDLLSYPGGNPHRLVVSESFSWGRFGIRQTGNPDYCSTDAQWCSKYYDTIQFYETIVKPQFAGQSPPTAETETDFGYYGVNDCTTFRKYNAKQNLNYNIEGIQAQGGPQSHQP
jgi:hypothetical protein